MNARLFRRLFLAAIAAAALAGCQAEPPSQVQGYIEGEYVYVAAPLAGQLKKLHVRKGASVQAGDALFTLDDEPERLALKEALERLAQSRALWEDSQKGKREPEIESLLAQLQQSETALARAEKDLAREETLVDFAASQQEIDRLRAVRDQERDRVRQLRADLETARMGAREDQVAAAAANVAALEAAVAKARWSLEEKSQSAPQAGLVFDTLYRVGEWVPAGRPADRKSVV